MCLWQQSKQTWPGWPLLHGLCRRIGLLLYEGGHGDVYAGPESFLRCATAPRDLTDPLFRVGLRSRGRDPVRPLPEPSCQLCAPIRPHSQIILWQDAEKARQRRSRIAQILNVPQKVRLRSSLAAALLDGLSEQPEKISEKVCGHSCDHGFKAIK